MHMSYMHEIIFHDLKEPITAEQDSQITTNIIK